MKALACLTVAFGMLVPASFSAAASDADISAAQVAATIWLSKLDADQFSESWELLSPGSKKAISRWRWNLQCKLGRMSLGRVRSRKEKSTEHRTKSPGGRSGEFIVLRYETSSEKKGTIIEEVAVEKDHDNQWRVGGYALLQEKD
jgi:hypothetical protein